MRRLQSGASSFFLRVSTNFWAWGSSPLPGGKRPVQSHSSCQPLSSLCLKGGTCQWEGLPGQAAQEQSYEPARAWRSRSREAPGCRRSSGHLPRLPVSQGWHTPGAGRASTLLILWTLRSREAKGCPGHTEREGAGRVQGGTLREQARLAGLPTNHCRAGVWPPPEDTAPRASRPVGVVCQLLEDLAVDLVLQGWLLQGQCKDLVCELQGVPGLPRWVVAHVLEDGCSCQGEPCWGPRLTSDQAWTVT